MTADIYINAIGITGLLTIVFITLLAIVGLLIIFIMR